jgi:phenylacetic acid degradation operon negative regulatory protein
MVPRSEIEELLLVLLWGTEKLLVPNWRNLMEPFEAWDYRQRWRRQLDRMEQRQLLQREQRANQLVWRLTDLGRLTAMGGINPIACWDRPWDGQWRMVLFDLPLGSQSVRVHLLRWLRRNRFGFLQNSVWIHPDPVTQVVELLKDYHDVESFTVMESHCGRGFTNDAIVAGAWDFDEINKRYDAYLGLWSLTTPEARKIAASASLFARWIRGERAAWRHPLTADPLLPRQLWPPGYRGPKAWQSRLQSLRRLLEHLPTKR